MSWNGDKLAWNTFIVSAGIVQRLGWEDHKLNAHTETLDVPSTSHKNLVNFSAVNHIYVVVSLQKVSECKDAHMQKYARLRCLHGDGLLNGRCQLKYSYVNNRIKYTDLDFGKYFGFVAETKVDLH